MRKKRVYFNEFNIPTNETIYFPYSSGLLRAYCERFDHIRENFEFMPFLFIREPIENIISQYDSPDVACFSVSLWNYRICLKVAEIIKSKYPDCLIVFGGPQVSVKNNIHEEYPFIDVSVFGEGERPLKSILEKSLDGVKFSGEVLKENTTIDDLDEFHSPYTLGYFKYLIDKHSDVEFKAIVETNRSCPFSCAFCFWGQNDLNKKIRHHKMEYIKQEAQWLAENKIKYIFCADANFGMFKRDIEVAQIYSDVKNRFGFPEKFRVCYGKNATDTIYQTAKVLSDSNLSKTVTLALQSLNPQVLKNIGRSNIKKETFIELQKKYSASNIPTYTEIILGLPGETVETFLAGLEFVLQSSVNNQVFIYHCQILPNTDMANPEYIQKYGLKTQQISLAEAHGSIRDSKIENETENIVIQTNTMTTEDWKYCAVVSWIVQLFYSLKVGHKISQYLHSVHNIDYIEYFKHLCGKETPEILYFKRIATSITKGMPRCQVDTRFGNIYYEPEELAFLYISRNKQRFYSELLADTIEFLENKKIGYDRDRIEQLFEDQSMEIPEPTEYPTEEEYATKVILHGRKSNLNKPTGFQLI